MKLESIKQYSNFISLGYFCGVADDLRKLGLRSVAYPFDWCLTDFKGIIELIDTRFVGFLDYQNMEQSVRVRHHYRDSKFGVFFFHDFSFTVRFPFSYTAGRFRQRPVRCRHLCRNPSQPDSFR